MPFVFISPDGKEKIVSKPVESKPVKAFTRGIVEGGLGSYGNVASLIPGYHLGRTLPGQEALSNLEANASDLDLAALSAGDEAGPSAGTLPTSEQVSQFLEMLGIKKEENTPQEQGLGRFGRGFGGGLATPGVGPQLALGTAFTGAGAAELAKAAGAGETGQNIAELIGTLRAPRARPTQGQNRVRQPRVVEKGIPPREAGFISPERLEQQLTRVAGEASDIASNIGAQNPTFQTISRSIEAGHPIQQRFNQVFTQLEDVAREFNPAINTQPLDSFLANEAQRYANTGAPTELGRFITNEINGWQRQGQPSLYNTFRRYRLNNERTREIIESVPRNERLSNLQRQQINFLSRMNEAIDNSFRNSLSPNLPAVPGQTGNQSSLWLRTFEDSNRAYSNYLNTRTARNILQPIINRNATDRQITGFLTNQRNWDDLQRFLGPQETNHLHQLLDDVVTARNSLQAFRRRDVTPELVRNALVGMIPGVGKLSHLFSLPTLWNWAKGRYQSSPSFQQNFHDLTKSLSERNINGIRKAAESIRDEDKGKEKKKKTFFVE